MLRRLMRLRERVIHIPGDCFPELTIIHIAKIRRVVDIEFLALADDFECDCVYR